MKHNKLIAGTLAFLMTISSVCMAAFAEDAVSGDANGDGRLNVRDAAYIAKALANNNVDSLPAVADYNGDTKINVRDAAAIAYYLANKSDQDTETDENTDNTESTENTEDTTVTEEPENPIVLSNAGITFDGTGAVLSEDLKTITITQPGVYTVTGEMTGGQIVVDVDKTTYVDGEVEISLEGMNLTNTETSPVYIAAIDGECIISAKKETVNTLTDGTSYTNADDGVGVIYSKDDLKIKGKGTLNINANCDDAIVSKNDIKIHNGTINIKAVDDAVKGKDSVKIGDKDDTEFDNLIVSVTSLNGDGFKSSSTEDGKGKVVINGGTVNLDVYSDGIDSAQSVEINGGSIDIETSESNTTTDTSAKGIKTGTDTITGIINVNGGNLNINTKDDCINSNGDINVIGGQLQLTTGSQSGYQALHADNSVYLGTDNGAYEDFSLVVYNAYEGIEAMNVYQKSGSTIVTSVDDAFNVAGGADGSGSTGGWPGQSGSASTSTGELVISGGLSIVSVSNGDHDGYDSNGKISITGGIAITNGQEPFDCDSGISYTGGVYIKNTGSGGMNGSSMSDSVSVSCSVSAGERITLCDGSGNVIVSFIADKNVSKLAAGCKAYTGASFYTGGELSGSTYFQQLDDTQSAAYGGTLTNGTSVSK